MSKKAINGQIVNYVFPAAAVIVAWFNEVHGGCRKGCVLQ